MTSRTERILIIDSDEHARSELGRYLSARGFYVSGYPDTTSARSLFDDNSPDIIFADLTPDAIRELAGRLDDAEIFAPIVAIYNTTRAADIRGYESGRGRRGA
jgi:sigma-B regulation protein RsbU (phosphoserine phosphatase)